jgi:heme/copper-type cytochrome/quinol oxidase subunit 2
MQKDLIGINKKIRLAGIAGAILAGFTLLQLLLPIAGFSPTTLVLFFLHARAEAARQSLPEIAGKTGLYLITNIACIVIVIALTIGIFRKNRWCGILFAAYCALTLIASLPTALFLFGIPSLLLAVIFFFILQGTLAIFDYNSKIRKESSKP